MTHTIQIQDEEVIKVLSNAVITSNGVLQIKEQLDRSMYLKVNKVLTAIGGRWDKKSKGHIFEDDPNDVIDEIISTRMVTDQKKLFQFYETPGPLVARLLDLAQIKKGMTVLEPSAGNGAIALKIKERKAVTVVELDPKRVEKLDKVGFGSVHQSDFLQYNVKYKKKYDRVVMNPPFTRQQDADHVTHAFRMLSVKGLVVGIVSPGFTFRTDKKALAFKQLVAQHGEYEENPEDSFKASGTRIHTLTVILNAN